MSMGGKSPLVARDKGLFFDQKFKSTVKEFDYFLEVYATHVNMSSPDWDDIVPKKDAAAVFKRLKNKRDNKVSSGLFKEQTISRSLLPRPVSESLQQFTG